MTVIYETAGQNGNARRYIVEYWSDGRWWSSLTDRDGYRARLGAFFNAKVWEDLGHKVRIIDTRGSK